MEQEIPKHKQRQQYFAQWVHGDDMPLKTLITGEYKGEKVFPDAYERQFRLIDAVIDAAIETNVLEMLLEGRRARQLLSSGFLRIPEGTDGIQAVRELQKTLPNVQMDDPPATKKEKCHQAVHALREAGWLMTSKHLCDPSELKENRDFMAVFAARWDEYEKALGEWRKNSIRGEECPRPPYSKDARFAYQPIDSNLAAFNELGGCIQLEETGHKSRASAVDKLARENTGAVVDGSDLNAATLKDMNRMKVVVSDPGSGERFLELLKQKMQRDGQGALQDNNILIGGWRLVNSGFLDRKTIVAFPCDAHAADLQAKGTVAEIMLTSPQLSVAHVLTHYIYDLIREMESKKSKDDGNRVREGELNVKRYFPEDGDNAQIQAEKLKAREYLFAAYTKAKENFDNKAEGQNVHFRFPEFDRSQFNSPEGLKGVLDKLIGFHQDVYVDLVNASEFPWQELYLKKAYAAEAELNEGVSLSGHRTPYLPDAMLERIGPEIPSQRKASWRDTAIKQYQEQSSQNLSR